MTMKRAFGGAMMLAATACGSGQQTGAPPRGEQVEPPVGALGDGGAERVAAPACVDVSVPPSAEFPFALSFQQARATTKAGDVIDIREVRGDRQRLERGGTYLVRGRYTLSSAEKATLLLSVTAMRRGEGCTTGSSPRGRVTVSRGSGDFELATVLPYEGEPHVTFYVDGRNGGGVYFGSAAQPER